jgi:hypothetical protein
MQIYLKEASYAKKNDGEIFLLMTLIRLSFINLLLILKKKKVHDN